MALKKIAQYYPTLRGGLITVTKDGRDGIEKKYYRGTIMNLNSKLNKTKYIFPLIETRRVLIFSCRNLKLMI